MKAVLVNVDERVLAERERLGLDKFDELWDGVLHMVPPAGSAHGGLNGDLYEVLAPLARAHGLRPFPDGTGLFRTPDDYRVPDQQHVDPELVTERGVEGPADLVVEIRSPRDETYDKLDFYAAVGVREVLVAHPAERSVELFVLRGDRLLLVQGPVVRSEVLDAVFETVDGPRLRITWKSGSADI